MGQTPVKTTRITKWQNGSLHSADDMLAVEEPLEIKAAFDNGNEYTLKNISITMRTPGHDEELALGFLFTEAVLKNPTLAKDCRIACVENEATVFFPKGHAPSLAQAERHFYATSSCGVCGKSSIDALYQQSPFLQTNFQLIVTSSLIRQLPEKLRAAQSLFTETGGIHACGFFSGDGRLILVREDVGRHNALDKLIGAALLQDMLPLENGLLLLSGRASFELMQKAYMAGIRFVAAVGAPSSLAVDLARSRQMTLLGFLKGDRFNVYSGAERITFETDETKSTSA